MTRYNFDKITNRKGTNCLKYDFAVERGKPADVLPLWVADMDFPVSEEITKSLHAAVEHGIYGYTQPKDAYYNAVMNWMERNHNWKTEREWIVKTPGVVFALGAAVKAFTDPGDAILIQNPVYYPFTNIIRDNDRRVVDNTLIYEKTAGQSGDNGYRIDFEDFERKLEQEHIKLFILCNPHNPVGRVWTAEELQQLGEICLRHHVIVVSDEIHNDFVYPGYEHTVFATVDPRFAEFTVTCTAPSKTFNLAGLQISNIFISNPQIRETFKQEINRAGYSQLNVAGLVGCEAAYSDGEEWYEAMKAYVAANIEYTKEYVEQYLSGVSMTEHEGTYLVWLDFRETGLGVEELEDLIIHKAKLWLDSGKIFGEKGKGFQRINVACPRATLTEALERIRKALEERK